MYLVVTGNEYGMDFESRSNPMTDPVNFIPTLEEAERKFDEHVEEGNFVVIIYKLMMPEPGSAYMTPIKTHREHY